MPEEQTRALSLIAAYGFGAEHGLAAEIAEIRNMAIDGMPHGSSVRRGYIAHLFRDRGLLEPFIQRHWAFGGTPNGAKKLRYYERLRTRHQQLLGGGDEDDDGAPEADQKRWTPHRASGWSLISVTYMRDCCELLCPWERPGRVGP